MQPPWPVSAMANARSPHATPDTTSAATKRAVSRTAVANAQNRTAATQNPVTRPMSPLPNAPLAHASSKNASPIITLPMTIKLAKSIKTPHAAPQTAMARAVPASLHIALCPKASAPVLQTAVPSSMWKETHA